MKKINAYNRNYEVQQIEWTEEKIQETPEGFKDKTIHDMVLSNREMANRLLYGNIPTNVVKGVYLNGNIEDMDYSKIEYMDDIQKQQAYDVINKKLEKKTLDANLAIQQLQEKLAKEKQDYEQYLVKLAKENPASPA